jgi:hypothetical protein
LTNKSIGPAADDLRDEIRDDLSISLDIRDASWFTNRQFTNPQRENASRTLIQHVVGPLLAVNNVTSNVAQAVSGQDARIGLLHLALDTNDKATDKSLTRSSFESLVLAALHETDSANRVPVATVVERVQAMLPAEAGHQVKIYVQSALDRLSKKNGKVKHWRQTGGYCLSFNELEQTRAELAGFLQDEEELEAQIADKLRIYVTGLRGNESRVAGVGKLVKEALEEHLLQLGEKFAAQVASGEPQSLDSVEFKSLLAKRSKGKLVDLDVEQVFNAACAFVADVDPAVGRHLRRLGDAYTLFAFLRQTPDVQKAIVSLFSDGEVWLDATVVLPLLAETLLEEKLQRRYTNILDAAFAAGLKLYVTDGVIEEIIAHISRAVLCARSSGSSWRSAVPFLYSEYISSGRPQASFVSWLEDFRGVVRPEQDIIDYLAETFKIEVRNLLDEADRATDDLRFAVKEYWISVHEKRRSKRSGNSEIDPAKIIRLAEHDTECYVGILTLRDEDRMTSRGYRQWWLCMDRAALALNSELRSEIPGWQGRSPVMNPDFLAGYLRIGPVRNALTDEQRVSIPVLTEMARHAQISPELIRVADETRQQNSELSERRIRRLVRDRLDDARGVANAQRLRSLSEVHDEIID